MNDMKLVMTAALAMSLASSAAPAASPTDAKPHLSVFRTEFSARQHCPNDRVVWASVASHTLYIPGDRHYAHTRGGFACESEARANGYRGPTGRG